MARIEETLNRMLMTNKMKYVCSVYETDDYDTFHELEHNRDATKKRVEKIKKSFLEGEVLNPIIVNEKFEIIDGQGRFEALKQLERSVKFIVACGTGIEDCRRMNQYSTNWSKTDFIDSYSNIESYQNLKQIVDETGLCFDKIMQIARKYSGGRGAGQELLRSGKLEFDNDDVAVVRKVVEAGTQIKQALAIDKNLPANFYVCVKIMMCADGYNHKRMLQNCKDDRHRFAYSTHQETLLKEFSRIYNFRRKAGFIRFEDYGRKMRQGVDLSKNFRDTSKSVKTLGGKNE
jgi:hypothetical protein